MKSAAHTFRLCASCDLGQAEHRALVVVTHEISPPLRAIPHVPGAGHVSWIQEQRAGETAELEDFPVTPVVRALREGRGAQSGWACPAAEAAAFGMPAPVDPAEERRARVVRAAETFAGKR